MTEEQKELLQQANVPMTWWEFCTIKDGTIYTPSTKTLYEKELVSEEEYKYWLSQQEQIDICPKKTTEERLEDLINQVDSMDAIIAELLMEV